MNLVFTLYIIPKKRRWFLAWFVGFCGLLRIWNMELGIIYIARGQHHIA